MRSGIWVLNIFATLWAVAGVLLGHLPAWLVFVPVALSAGLLVWASRQPLGTGNAVRGDHVGRLVATATMLELIAIIVTQNVLISHHLRTLMMPAVAIIVGVHFLPLARWIPVRVYYRTGGALIGAGVVGLLLPQADRALWTGVVAALILWSSAVMLVRRGRG